SSKTRTATRSSSFSARNASTEDEKGASAAPFFIAPRSPSERGQHGSFGGFQGFGLGIGQSATLMRLPPILQASLPNLLPQFMHIHDALEGLFQRLEMSQAMIGPYRSHETFARIGGPQQKLRTGQRHGVIRGRCTQERRQQHAAQHQAGRLDAEIFEQRSQQGIEDVTGIGGTP